MMSREKFLGRPELGEHYSNWLWTLFFFVTCHSFKFKFHDFRCYSENSTAIARELCEGRTICSPDVSSQIFGDPCHGIYKYLEVDFICVPVQNYLTYKSVGETFPNYFSYYLQMKGLPFAGSPTSIMKKMLLNNKDRLLSPSTNNVVTD